MRGEGETEDGTGKQTGTVTEEGQVRGVCVWERGRDRKRRDLWLTDSVFPPAVSSRAELWGWGSTSIVSLGCMQDAFLEMDWISAGSDSPRVVYAEQRLPQVEEEGPLLLTPLRSPFGSMSFLLSLPIASCSMVSSKQ